MGHNMTGPYRCVVQCGGDTYVGEPTDDEGEAQAMARRFAIAVERARSRDETWVEFPADGWDSLDLRARDVTAVGVQGIPVRVGGPSYYTPQVVGAGVERR